jgi:ribosomal protein L34
MLLRFDPRARARSVQAMKIKIRKSNTKRRKKNGFLTRQKTAGGRKVNARQRKRHGRI